jgi:hypothetical protein
VDGWIRQAAANGRLWKTGGEETVVVHPHTGSSGSGGFRPQPLAPSGEGVKTSLTMAPQKYFHLPVDAR